MKPTPCGRVAPGAAGACWGWGPHAPSVGTSGSPRGPCLPRSRGSSHTAGRPGQACLGACFPLGSPPGVHARERNPPGCSFSPPSAQRTELPPRRAQPTHQDGRDRVLACICVTVCPQPQGGHVGHFGGDVEKGSVSLSPRDRASAAGPLVSAWSPHVTRHVRRRALRGSGGVRARPGSPPHGPHGGAAGPLCAPGSGEALTGACPQAPAASRFLSCVCWSTGTPAPWR